MIPDFIKEISNMNDTKNYIDEILKNYKPEEILCLFDIDQTILNPVNPAYQLPNIVKYRQIYEKTIKKYSGFYPSVLGLYYLVDDHIVFDDNVYKLLQELNNKRIKNIALTATPNIEIKGQNLPKVRYNQLKENEISFEKSFEVDEILLNDLKLYKNNFPLYYRGVLCSNGSCVYNYKGIVLDEFLKKVNYDPKCIILVDDNWENNVDVCQVLAEKRSNVDFYGIHFTEAYHINSEDISKEEFEKKWEDICYAESLTCKELIRDKKF